MMTIGQVALSARMRIVDREAAGERGVEEPVELSAGRPAIVERRLQPARRGPADDRRAVPELRLRGLIVHGADLHRHEAQATPTRVLGSTAASAAAIRVRAEHLADGGHLARGDLVDAGGGIEVVGPTVPDDRTGPARARERGSEGEQSDGHDLGHGHPDRNAGAALALRAPSRRFRYLRRRGGRGPRHRRRGFGGHAGGAGRDIDRAHGSGRIQRRAECGVNPRAPSALARAPGRERRGGAEGPARCERVHRRRAVREPRASGPTAHVLLHVGPCPPFSSSS